MPKRGFEPRTYCLRIGNVAISWEIGEIGVRSCIATFGFGGAGMWRSRAWNNSRSYVIHRARVLLVRHRTTPINALRGHMAECGIADLLKTCRPSPDVAMQDLAPLLPAFGSAMLW